jgi:ornithine cyclodeaminase/alanine dehydrogenase-like protein (mu-crystallin family)
VSQTRLMGELRAAIAAGAMPDAAHAELGAVIAGAAPGRAAADAVTIADLTGTGVQDTAIAALALDRAAASGTGAAFDT